MAKIMLAKFGSALAKPTWAVDQPAVPVVSPELYKRKFIIKAKRPKASYVAADAAANSTRLAREQEEFAEDPEDANANEELAAAKKKGDEAQKKMTVAKELADLVIMSSKHYKNNDMDQTAYAHEVCSLGESKSAGISQADVVAYREYNKLRLTRVFPSGARVNSSNMHPQEHWDGGCQLVAMNWQDHNGYPLRFYKGRFHENGNSGYLLKPLYMRDKTVHAPQEASVNLTVTVLSAMALPKPKSSEKGEIVDPYVFMYLEGPSLKSNDKYRTETIQNNGFHPVWQGDKTTTTFEVPVSSMTTLVVQIFDSDGHPGGAGDDLLAEAFLPVHLLRGGLRVVPLWTVGHKALKGSFLMANFQFDGKPAAQ